MSEVRELVDTLRSQTAAATPGRSGLLCEVRVAQLLGVPSAAASDSTLGDAVRNWPTDPSITAAERAVLGVAEQFVLDPHGLTDEEFLRLREHYAPAEVVAIIIHLGLLNGFDKFDLMRSVGSPEH